jgi:PAS domain S-box-containing protein
VEAFALFHLGDAGLVELVVAHGYGPDVISQLTGQVGAVGRLKVDDALHSAESVFSRPIELRDAEALRPEWFFRICHLDATSGALVFSADSDDAVRLHEGMPSVLGFALAARRDLIDMLHSYEFSRSILRDVSTGLIAIDPLGRVIYFNPAAERILGMAVGEAVGADALRVFRTLVDGENVLLEGLKGDMPEIELWVRRSDGREIPVELRLSQIRSRDGGVLGAVGIFRDLSDIKSMEERVRHRDRLATIGELAAGIAHEIGNPLTGIRGCAQLLRDRLVDDDESQKFVSVIMEEVDRLSRLANQVRQYARPSTPRMQKAAVGACLDRVLMLVSKEADDAGISIHCEVASDLEEIWHDPDQIQQVLHNLVQNAIQAMKHEGGRLEIGVQPFSRQLVVGGRRGRRAGDRFAEAPKRAERAFVRIRVRDTGPGIATDHLQRIFNPFFTTKPDGLGLGLSVSQTIVGEHGGFLSVVSEPGKGTTFFLDLPVDRRAR